MFFLSSTSVYLKFLKVKFIIQDWSRNHSGDPEIEAALKRGEDPGLALVSWKVLVVWFFYILFKKNYSMNFDF